MMLAFVFFLFPFFGFGFVMYFLPSIIALGAQQARHSGDLSAEFVSGMERDWVDCGAGMGCEE